MALVPYAIILRMRVLKGVLVLLTIGLVILPGCSSLGLSCESSAEPTPVPTGPLDADFVASQTQCSGTCWVTFTSTSSGHVKEWYWDFDGDDVTDATGPEVKHYFNVDGYYTVSLTVLGWDGEQDIEIKPDYIYTYGCKN